MLKAFYKHGKHGARGYVSENISADLLKITLYSSEGSFLIEPVLASWIMERVFGDPDYAIAEDLLTPREKEISNLLRKGMDRQSVARQLNIAETTLKTHIKNISRKRKQVSADASLPLGEKHGIEGLTLQGDLYS